MMQLDQEGNQILQLGLIGVISVGHKLGLDSKDFSDATASVESSQGDIQSGGEGARTFVDTSNKEHESPKQPKEQERTSNRNSSVSDTPNGNEVYVGTYESGLKAYVLADTLKMENYRHFSVTVKAVEDNNNIIYVDYRFSGAAGQLPRWKNSQGYSGTVDYNIPSVEKNIHAYFSERWSEHVRKKK